MRNLTHLLAVITALGFIATACGDGPDDVGPASPGPAEVAEEAASPGEATATDNGDATDATGTDTSDDTDPDDDSASDGADTDRDGATDDATSSDEAAGPTADLDQAAFEAIAQDVVERFGIPGAALQVRVDGQEPTTAIAGVADIETQRALTATDQLRIYSVTKAVTALIVLQLVDEGAIDLDDPITDWLAPAVIGDVANHDRMTIRQLLTHSSGTPDYFDSVRPGEQQPAFVGELLGQAQTGEYHWYDPQELVDFAIQFEPPFAPEEGAAYSNTGYVLLGLIVESVTGNPIHDEMNARVIDPLGLTATYLETPDTANDYIPGYIEVAPGRLVSVAGSNSSFAWAAGGLISSIHDLGRLTDAIFTGELLTAASHQTMFTFVQDSKAEVVQWGMGVYRFDSPWGPVHVAEGGAPGYTATAFRFPDQDTTILAMFNSNDTAAAFQQAVDDTLGLLGA